MGLVSATKVGGLFDDKSGNLCDKSSKLRQKCLGTTTKTSKVWQNLEIRQKWSQQMSLFVNICNLLLLDVATTTLNALKTNGKV